MIEDRHVGTHAQQLDASKAEALRDAGIGTAYANRSLEEAGERGANLKTWFLANLDRIREGHGFDFRGDTPETSEVVMLTARAILLTGIQVRVMPLVKIPRLLGDKDGEAFLRSIRHLIIRDFETSHENPLRPYETALIEAMIEDRMGDNLGVSVMRRGTDRTGWWSGMTEALIEQRTKVVL